MNDLICRVERFSNTALQRWSEFGVDQQTGAFVEALDFSGKPLLNLNKRFRVQARQIYVYGFAARLGYGDHYLSIAEHAYQFACRHYLSKEQGWVMAIDCQNNVVDKHCNAYEQSFMLLAAAELFALTAKDAYRQCMAQTWAFLQQYLSEKKYGGFQLSYPHDQPLPRQQNPHMHLFEACLHAFSLTKDVIWQQRANDLYHLFEQYFFAHDEHCLREFFTESWQPDPRVGDELEPGHHYEWVWLLSQYHRQCGCDVSDIQQAIYHYANQYGTDGSSFAIDKMLPKGEVLLASKRLWVQTEVLKAHLAMFEQSGQPHLIAVMTAHVERMFDKYLLEEQGSWVDRLDQQDNNVSQYAPASTFYHLFLSFAEFLRIMKKH